MQGIKQLIWFIAVKFEDNNNYTEKPYKSEFILDDL